MTNAITARKTAAMARRLPIPASKLLMMAGSFMLAVKASAVPIPAHLRPDFCIDYLLIESFFPEGRSILRSLHGDEIRRGRGGPAI
jgi:hypothetical protein